MPDTFRRDASPDEPGKKKADPLLPMKQPAARAGNVVQDPEQVWLMQQVRRGHARMFSDSFEMTPARASYILEFHNKGNRTLKNTNVDLYMRIIQNGQWKVTGQGLIFDINGRLSDGQHRLEAIRKAGRTVRVWITFGDKPVNVITYDTGCSRKACDALKMAGESYTTSLAGSIRQLHNMEVGTRHTSLKVSNEETLRRLNEEHSGLRASSTAGNRLAKELSVSATGATTAHYLIAKDASTLDLALLDDFWAAVISGAELRDKDPRLMLSKFLNGQRYTSLNAVATWKVTVPIIQGWNAFVTGKRASFTWGDGEEFPKPLYRFAKRDSVDA